MRLVTQMNEWILLSQQILNNTVINIIPEATNSVN